MSSAPCSSRKLGLETCKQWNLSFWKACHPTASARLFVALKQQTSSVESSMNCSLPCSCAAFARTRGILSRGASKVVACSATRVDARHSSTSRGEWCHTPIFFNSSGASITHPRVSALSSWACCARSRERTRTSSTVDTVITTSRRWWVLFFCFRLKSAFQCCCTKKLACFSISVCCLQRKKNSGY